MAEYLDKVSIQGAVRPFKDFDLSCQQLTTSTFMRPTIPYIKEFPKCKIECNLKSYARLMPLEHPVLGSVQVYNRAFWVPMRVLWHPWSAFITNSPYVNDDGTVVLNSVPNIKVSDLFDIVKSNSVVIDDDDAVFDFQSLGGTKYKMNATGRHIFKIFRQLGYPFLDTANKNRVVSAMPLLAFTKVMLDWYFPSQYANTGVYASAQQVLQIRRVYTLRQHEILTLLAVCVRSFYKNDYFTSCWDSPVSPNLGTYDGITIPDISVIGAAPSDMGVNGDWYHPYASTTGVINDIGVSNAASNGTPIADMNIRSSQQNAHRLGMSVSQFGHDSLKALTNYVKRHQLVGSRVLDRYLADFGVRLDSEVLSRSVYIGSQTFPIQFSDVMSNSDTQGAVLGDYAGKGVAYDGSGKFEYVSDEYGYFLIINEIIPDIAYYQGYDRNVDHLGFLDFFQPEFESLGTQAVKVGELNSLFSIDENNLLDSIFGYLPRYSEYRIGRDSVTGDFLLNTRNVGLMGWSTVRDVVDYTQAHSLSFLIGNDAAQYQRIFYGDSLDESDNFIFVHRVNIKVAMQMSPQYDTYDFDEKYGDEIIMQANGTKLS